MSVFTVFFCGTAASRLDVDNHKPGYPKGETIATLASQCKGNEFTDWIICDGPGSGNLHEDEPQAACDEPLGHEGLRSSALALQIDRGACKCDESRSAEVGDPAREVERRPRL